MKARRMGLVLVAAIVVAVAASLPASAARRGVYVYDGYELGFQRACRDGVELTINYVEPTTQLLGDLVRTGQRVLDRSFALASDPERPPYYTLTTTALWSAPLLPGDRVQLIERRSFSGGGSDDLERAYVTIADCALADLTGGVYLYGPATMDLLPNALPGGPPQILYLYGQASPANSGLTALLAQLGFAVEARTLVEASGLTAAALSSGYDHVVVGDDTGTLAEGGPVWAGSAGLETALRTTTAPVTGIGLGGYALFNAIGTSVAANADPVVRAVGPVRAVRSSFGDPDVWPKGDQFEQAALYTGPAELVAGAAQPPLVQRRVAEPLPVAGDPATLVAVAGEPDGGRCLSYWGFRAPAAQLSGLGKSLLARIVAETACTAQAVGARTADTALAVDDPILVARARAFLCLAHTAQSQLEVLLLAPDGRVVELVGATSDVAGGFGRSGETDSCDSRSAYGRNAAFSDDSGYSLANGTTPFTDRAYLATGQGGLAALRGSQARGVWVLRVRDLVPPLSGEISDPFPEWALEFEADGRPFKVRLPEVRR